MHHHHRGRHWRAGRETTASPHRLKSSRSASG
jgi:hypothetical protein